MAKGPDKQIAIEAAKAFLMGVESELQPIQLPSGTHDYMYKILRAVAEIKEEEILATPNYKRLFQLVNDYIIDNKVNMAEAVDKIAAAKENYAQDYLFKFLKKKALNEKPAKVESALKYWE